ncbi:TPA: type I toxin-antitoxin system Ibs family toxin, partial [Escherichia coli]|nr:type I toxin-antitoxin system Ibs family toxin [Escherichia coli]
MMKWIIIVVLLVISYP